MGRMLDVAQIRKDFPILGTQVHGNPLVYLDNAATTHKPNQVLERVLHLYRHCNGNIHRGAHALSEAAEGAYEEARGTIRRFINARSEAEVIFTSSTTGAINLLAHSLGEALVGEGDQIVVGATEHHSNLVPWQVLCAHRKATLKVIPMDERGRLQVEALPALLGESTRLVAVCHVSNALGVINPVEEIIDLGHQVGVPVLVDAAQSVPHFPVDVQALDCDFLVFSGHKMYAETGIGVLYGKEDLLDRLPPHQTGGGMVSRVTMGHATYAGLPQKFEAGTPNIAGAVSLGEAVNYMLEVGRDPIAAHEQDLLHAARERLRAEEGLTLYGDGLPHCSTVSFNLEGIHPFDAGQVLDKLGIAVRTGTHCAEPVMQRLGVNGTIRASFAMYNTHEEVDALVEGIRRVKRLLG